GRRAAPKRDAPSVGGHQCGKRARRANPRVALRRHSWFRAQSQPRRVLVVDRRRDDARGQRQHRVRRSSTAQIRPADANIVLTARIAAARAGLTLVELMAAVAVAGVVLAVLAAVALRQQRIFLALAADAALTGQLRDAAS